MTSPPKSRWGSQPGKERGGMSHGELAYIRKVNLARSAGTQSAKDPRRAETHCPASYDEDQRSYWLAAFRRERRRG
jgi:hypothetical protein